MTQETYMDLTEKYEIRDIDTKKIYMKFRTPGAARMYWISMNFGLKHFYEVYDIKNDKVLYQSIKYKRNYYKKLK